MLAVLTLQVAHCDGYIGRTVEGYTEGVVVALDVLPSHQGRCASAGNSNRVWMRGELPWATWRGF